MSSHPTTAFSDRRRSDRPRRPGRTIMVALGALALLVSAVLPGLTYVQARADGRPVEVQGSAAAGTVSLDVQHANVTILPAEGDEITWDVSGGVATVDADARVEGDTVAIEVGDLRGWRLGIGDSSNFRDWGPSGIPFLSDGSKTPQVTVSVPAGTDVVVELDIGRLVAEGIDVGDLAVTSDLADVELSGAAENLTADMDLGDLRARDLDVTGAMDVTTSLGNLDLASSVVPGSVDVRSELGDVSLALPPGPYRVSTRSELGDIANRLTVVPGDPIVPLDLATDLGSITLQDY